MPIITCAEKSISRCKRHLLFIFLLLFIVGQVGFFALWPGLMAATAIGKNGVVFVAVTPVYPECGAGEVLAQLKQNQPVLVIEEELAEDGLIWYKVSWQEEEGREAEGWLPAANIQLEAALARTTTALNNDAAFTAWLVEQQFPESYWPALRALHEKYPNWVFKSVATNLSFADAVKNLSSPGAVLIPNTYNDAYKSTEPEAYDWYTDKWKPYDGSSWMICSKATVEYYMDPRNFLTERDIFQFESLNYQMDVHDEAGVEKILQNSFMGNKTFTYIDAKTQEEKTMTYAAAFVEAGKFSDVSPYHLASRSLVEVSSRGSPSVSGLFSQALLDRGLPVTYDYDGYYNFYNIGASASTEPLGNVRNGLEYAKYGSDRKPAQTAADDRQLIPWSDPYRSIVGGSVVIGANYINANKTNARYADQNTLYLQKFNVGFLPDSNFLRRYWHLYMGNVLAPTVEGRKIYDAYKDRDDLGKPITFLIPIYSNLPQSCPKPEETGNPNNWLKTLAIKEFSLTPTFDAAVTDNYSLIVDHTVKTVELIATSVNNKAQVVGAGQIDLKTGENICPVTVTAENGNKRTYTVTIIREKHPDDLPPAEIQSDKLQIHENDLVSGLDPAEGANTVANVLQSIEVAEDYTLRIVDKDNKPVEQLVGTGHRIQLLYLDEVLREYMVLLYGDANGDGRVDSADLYAIFQHILTREILSENYIKAADADRDGKIDSSDLYVVFKHILHREIIKQ